ncbi:maltose/maltodextrin ABC transporter, substrate binding periplasmic protein MalE [Lachnospiraceae bacterium KM106-2]|nr:maltose/maltodextrin ABC transporter, substrate binding periplasmic protein MalE [Lachnospiraceae bacterium KM106-2]
MKKKIILGLSMLLMLCSLSLVGCGKKSSKDKVVIWSNMEVESDLIVKYGKMWSKKTGHEIQIVHETPDLQQFVQATNSSSGPDAVVGISNDQLADYVTAGRVAEVPNDLYKDEEYADAAVQACYVNGKRYAAPLAVETVTLFYNTDKIKEAPKTWDELLKVGEKQGGIQFDATSIYYDLGFVRAYDSYIFPYADGKYDIKKLGLGNEGAVKAYQFIEALATKYKFISSNVTSDIAKSNFQNGKTAFYIGGPWDIDGLKKAGTHFAVAKMPTLNNKKFVTPVGTQVSFVSSKSKKQKLAWDFILYLMDHGALDMYQVGSRIPAKLEFQQNEKIKADPISAVFIEQIADGEPMPTVSELGQVWTPYQNNMKALLNKKIDATQAAANIEKQITEGIGLMKSGK